MANHSEADPVGLLSYDTLATWFGIEGENGNYRAVQGGKSKHIIPYLSKDIADNFVF